MSGTLARRLGRLEAVATAEQDRRVDEAMRVLGATMTREHIALVQEWQGRPEVRADFAARPRDQLLARILRLGPPALVRAVMLLVAGHVADGLPLALPDYVADVYIDDPEALPLNPCEGCGYHQPIQGRLLPDGRVRYTGVSYVGPCPVCSGYRNGMRDERVGP